MLFETRRNASERIDALSCSFDDRSISHFWLSAPPILPTAPTIDRLTLGEVTLVNDARSHTASSAVPRSSLKRSSISVRMSSDTELSSMRLRTTCRARGDG